MTNGDKGPRIPDVRSHRDLRAWKLGMTIVERVYALTGKFPRAEQFGLAAQLRRAAVSIPCNIAEGHRRGTTPQYAHFIAIARGSGAEVETQIEIAARLGYIDANTADELQEQLDHLSRMLARLRASLH